MNKQQIVIPLGIGLRVGQLSWLVKLWFRLADCCLLCSESKQLPCSWREWVSLFQEPWLVTAVIS